MILFIVRCPWCNIRLTFKKMFVKKDDVITCDRCQKPEFSIITNLESVLSIKDDANIHDYCDDDECKEKTYGDGWMTAHELWLRVKKLKPKRRRKYEQAFKEERPKCEEALRENDVPRSSRELYPSHRTIN